MSNSHVEVTRRAFIRTLLGALAAALVPGCNVGGPPDREQLIGYLTKVLRHDEAAAGLGQAYISADPAMQALSTEQWAMMLLQRIGVDLNKPPAIDVETLRRKLGQQVRQDFADETAVFVDGWLLSLTEARLCALVYRYRNSAS